MLATYVGRPLLVIPLMAPLIGCETKPVGQPIVLRPPHAGKLPPRASNRSAARAAGRAAPVARPAPPAGELSPEQKEDLFRDFDDYLARSGKQ